MQEALAKFWVELGSIEYEYECPCGQTVTPTKSGTLRILKNDGTDEYRPTCLNCGQRVRKSGETDLPHDRPTQPKGAWKQVQLGDYTCSCGKLITPTTCLWSREENYKDAIKYHRPLCQCGRVGHGYYRTEPISPERMQRARQHFEQRVREAAEASQIKPDVQEERAIQSEPTWMSKISHILNNEAVKEELTLGFIALAIAAPILIFWHWK